MVKRSAIFAAACVVLAAAVAAAPSAPRYALPASVVTLIVDGSGIREFAANLRHDADAALAGPAMPADEARRWLGLSVHLALLAGVDVKAQAAAERLRELQPDPAVRAYTGVTTHALCVVRRSGGGSDAAAFGREFARRLAELPRTTEMRDVLERQRARSAALTAESVHADASVLAARVGTAPHVDVATADEIIRLRHRLVDLVPLRAVTLAALDAAIREL